jgi:hypothetical protein
MIVCSVVSAIISGKSVPLGTAAVPNGTPSLVMLRVENVVVLYA